jgi:hypothetical protein
MDNVVELEGKGSWRNVRRDAETWVIKSQKNYVDRLQ